MNRLRNEIASGVVVYDNAMDGDFVVEAVEAEANNPNSIYVWDWSSTGPNSHRGDYRTSYSFPLESILDPNNEHPLRGEMQNEVIGKLSVMYNDYTSRFIVDTGFTEPPSVLKYVAGGRYRTHSDAGPTMHRIISCVGCLGNTATGGDLEFPLIDLRIRLEQNQFIMFPSNFMYQHYAHPVNDGVKYSLVTWWGVR